MKNIRQFFTAAVLTVILSGSAFAGDLWTPGIIAPPPPGEGRVANNPSHVEVTALDTLTESIVLLCQTMLSQL